MRAEAHHDRRANRLVQSRIGLEPDQTSPRGLEAILPTGNFSWQRLCARFLYSAIVVTVSSCLLCSSCWLSSCSAQNSEDSHMLDLKVNAPELSGGLGWLNTDRPVKLADLRGKIVLLDFWTFCCINCMHIIPE